MELNYFVKIADFSDKKELDKVKLLALYYYEIDKTISFNFDDIIIKLKQLGHPISNVSRLKGYLTKSKDFKKINIKEYMLVPNARKKLSDDMKEIFVNNEYIESDSEILDERLFSGYRSYMDKLIYQINNCYQNHCYDACAVCMRRLFEITLIHAYEKNQIQEDIKSNGDYFMLEKIVANAVTNKTLDISRSRKDYDKIRELGNYAAHKILYNTRKNDIDDIKSLYRVCLEELYYKAGLLN